MSSDVRKTFKQSVDRVLWKIHELEATITDFNGDQGLLNDRLNGLVAGLRELQAAREAVAVDVPVELLQYVDGGGNPDAFTADVFRRANRGNQLAKGRVQALAGFREALLSEAAAAFPEDTAAYRALTKPAAAPAAPEQAPPVAPEPAAR